MKRKDKAKTQPTFPRQYPSFLLAMSLLVLVIGFQNCSSFMADPSAKAFGLLEYASTGGEDLQPATDKIDANCMSKSSYDACLFRKNPVAVEGKALTPGVTTASLSPLQTFGVKLTGLDSSGLLKNSTLRIETLTGSTVSTQTNSLKFSAQNDGTKYFLQVQTYYWLNRAAEYLLAHTSVLPAQGKNIRVVVDDTIAGWSPKTNSIHLALDDNGNAMAWNADLAIHFFGLANLHHATGGAISSLGSAGQAKHLDCEVNSSPKTNGCCATQVGCARAIASGVGDFFVAMIFPDKTGIGETWVNNANGLSSCGLSRTVSTASARTAQTTFQACNGEVSSMGTLYASLWWDIRYQAQAVNASGAQEIDTLFMQHLALLTGADDFTTAREKIKALDQRLYSGRHTQIITTQFQTRGL